MSESKKLSQEDRDAYLAWTDTVRREVSNSLKWYRATRGWTTSELADHLRDVVKADISRSTIAKMESGERTAFTISDVLALSYALGVAPVSLVVPTGRHDSVEMLPGRRLPIDLARRWFTGTEGLDSRLVGDLEQLEMARRHDLCVARLMPLSPTPQDLDTDESVARERRTRAEGLLHEVDAASDDEPTSDGPAVDAAQAAYQEADEAYKRLRTIHMNVPRLRAARRDMRMISHVPPPLAPSLAWIDDEEVTPGA